MYEPVLVTPDNLHSAFNENVRRIAVEVGYKFPVVGNTTLLGDLDFQTLYTILGARSSGERSAVSLQRATYVG